MTTVIENPSDPRVQAISLKGHLRMLNLGMKHSRLNGADILKAASRITSREYKRGQYQQALDDLIAWMETKK